VGRSNGVGIMGVELGGQIAAVMGVASNVGSRTKGRQITPEDAYILYRGL